MVGVQPAGVREHPDRPAADAVLLETEVSTRTRECGPVGRHADDRDQPGGDVADQRPERGGSLAQLLGAQLGGRPRGTVGEVGDADAERRQVAVLVGREDAGRESRSVQRRPEPVARPREVVAALRGGQRRVDADEQDPKARPDDIP